jgi:hypothetical protein
VPRLCLVVLVVVGGVGLVAAPGALAKGRVTARIEQPTRCDAAAGKKLTVAFSLTSAEADGTARPFGASGVFVKLRRADGRSLKVRARSDRRGHYRARIVVPHGGLRRIDTGLEGETIRQGVTHDADVVFTTRGDPCRAS